MQGLFHYDKLIHMNITQAPVIWLTGLSGSGKSTIAEALQETLFDMGLQTRILDGDSVRDGLSSDLGFSDEDRKENMRRISEVAKLFSESGIFTITAFISPFEKERSQAKEIIGENNFIEIHVATPLDLCEERDPKGLYKKARAGEIPQFTGIDSPYEEPTHPDMIIKTRDMEVHDCVDEIIQYLVENNFLVRNAAGWGQRNHGGSPTPNKDPKRAIFVGRYQPYHHGHTSLVQQKLDQGIGALIMVRDIEPDEKNPFTTEQTVAMIRKYHDTRGDDVEVVVIPDVESVNYGRGVGYEINEYVPPKDIGFVSATKIRDSLATGDEAWKDMVDASIHDDVIDYLQGNN